MEGGKTVVSGVVTGGETPVSRVKSVTLKLTRHSRCQTQGRPRPPPTVGVSYTTHNVAKRSALKPVVLPRYWQDNRPALQGSRRSPGLLHVTAGQNRTQPLVSPWVVRNSRVGGLGRPRTRDG